MDRTKDQGDDFAMKSLDKIYHICVEHLNVESVPQSVFVSSRVQTGHEMLLIFASQFQRHLLSKSFPLDNNTMIPKGGSMKTEWDAGSNALYELLLPTAAIMNGDKVRNAYKREIRFIAFRLKSPYNRSQKMTNTSRLQALILLNSMRNIITCFHTSYNDQEPNLSSRDQKNYILQSIQNL